MKIDWSNPEGLRTRDGRQVLAAIEREGEGVYVAVREGVDGAELYVVGVDGKMWDWGYTDGDILPVSKYDTTEKEGRWDMVSIPVNDEVCVVGHKEFSARVAGLRQKVRDMSAGYRTLWAYPECLRRANIMDYYLSGVPIYVRKLGEKQWEILPQLIDGSTFDEEQVLFNWDKWEYTATEPDDEKDQSMQTEIASEIENQIKIMQHFAQGGSVEYQHRSDMCWNEWEGTRWNFANYNYRIVARVWVKEYDSAIFSDPSIPDGIKVSVTIKEIL
jgi:hypothetical protein